MDTEETAPAAGLKLIIQIPCFNEEQTLPATLADLPRHVEGFACVEWLVIDDGSEDNTSQIASDLGVDHVVRITRNRGLAHAFLTGLDASLKAGADVIVNTDADNQYDGACIPRLVAPILAGQADLVIGERPIEAVDDFSPLKKRLQRFGSGIVRTFSATEVRDAASGFRAFSRSTAIRTQVFGKYSYTMETIVQAGWEGLRIVGVDVAVNPATRPSRLVKSIPRYIWRSAQTILRSFALYKPLRFFLGLGLGPLLISLALVLRWFYFHLFTEDQASRVPSLVGAAMMFLLAVLIWMFGFLADLLSVNRRILSDTRVMLRTQELDRRAEPETAGHLDENINPGLLGLAKP
ncbi:MAG: glycosyltransferase [Actinobacteria bacterium]|nr:glycosyltransferase [Actinomycetota bacterium]